MYCPPNQSTGRVLGFFGRLASSLGTTLQRCKRPSAVINQRNDYRKNCLGFFRRSHSHKQARIHSEEFVSVSCQQGIKGCLGL